MELRDYQKEIVRLGVNVLKEHKFVYLAMEVRTGKTLTSLSISKTLAVSNVLFITKKKAISSIQDDYNLLNPDFAPKAKMTVSRIKFNKWLIAYNQFKYDCNPEEGRDNSMRWIRFRNKHELEINTEIEF